MDLYLVRHAVAFGRDAARWPDDSARPLTPEPGPDTHAGERRATLLALPAPATLRRLARYRA